MFHSRIAAEATIAADAAKADKAAVSDVVDAMLGLEEDDDNAGAFDYTPQADAAAGSTTVNFASTAVTDETSVTSPSSSMTSMASLRP